MATIEEQNEIAIKAMQFKNKIIDLARNRRKLSQFFDDIWWFFDYLWLIKVCTMDSDQPVLNDSDDRSHNDNSDGGQNGKFPFPTPKLFGKQRGRGVAIHLPVSATDFLMRVNTIIEDEDERGKLFDALRNYLETKKVKRLVRELKLVLDNSKKYPLFKEIRAFIESEHLFAFDKLTEGARTGERIIHLKRHGTEPLGFKFKGGLEHNIGIYVTSIVPGSAAHFSGLRIGDEILKVNGFVLHESIHDEVVNVLKSKKSLTFVTKNMGKIPNKVNNRIVWQEVDPNMNLAISGIWDPNFANHAPGSPKSSTTSGNEDKLVALKVGKDGLGCSIRSGIENFTGVFISAVTPNHLAEQVGLRVGDQLLQVNGKLFDNIQHSEAVNVLKSRKDLTMIIRHNEEVADYLLKRNKKQSEEIKPILILEEQQRELEKHASFGEEPVVEYIEPIILTEEEEQLLESEINDESEAVQVGEGNYQFGEDITQGREVHLVSILKTAPLMLDLEMKNDMIVVRSATKGGAAADNGFLKRGDVLLNVEGVDLTGLNAVEAQEAISDAMGRLSHHIDLIVACLPGRKPPEHQSIETFFEAYSQLNSGHSDGYFESERQEINDGAKSIVTKFIAQFESHSRKSNAFLLRRDSLEKARNSLRLYRGNKRRPSLSKVLPPNQVQAMSSSTSDGLQINGTQPHSIANSISADHGTQPHSIANSISADLSPQVSRKSAFAMHDPTPINIASNSAAKQNWTSAVRKVSESGGAGMQSINGSDRGPVLEPLLESSKLDGAVKVGMQSTKRTDWSPGLGASPGSDELDGAVKVGMQSTSRTDWGPGLGAPPGSNKLDGAVKVGMQSTSRTDWGPGLGAPPGSNKLDGAVKVGMQSTSRTDWSPGSGAPPGSSKSEGSINFNGYEAHESSRSSNQYSQLNQASHLYSVSDTTSVDGSKNLVESRKHSGDLSANLQSKKHFAKDRDTVSTKEKFHSKSDDIMLSPNQRRVQALVHSPPQSTSDDTLNTWAPISPQRGLSTSTENLMSRRPVAFNKHITEIGNDDNVLSSKFKSKSMDELNERVEKFPASAGNYQDRRASNQPRKKSVGFKETVERIEPSAFRSMDDISMIGRSGWEDRMSRYDVKRPDSTKHVEQLSVPIKSALRNSPSPLRSDGDDYDHRHMPYDAEVFSPNKYGSSPEDMMRSSASMSSSSRHLKLMPSNSLDDDPNFNEEIDRLARSVDKSFVIPEPDYEGASGHTSSHFPPQNLPASKEVLPSGKKSSPKRQQTKEKKKDAPFGVTNKLLNTAKDKLKRVGFRRSSQTPVRKGNHDTVDKHSDPSKPSPPTAKASLAKPPAPPPPPPPPSLQAQSSTHIGNVSQVVSSFSMQQPPPIQQSQSIPRMSQTDQLSDRPTVTSQNPPGVDSSLANMIKNSPVRKAAAVRDFSELEDRGFKQALREYDENDAVNISRSMDSAMASAVMEDVKIASVVADNNSGPRAKSFKGNKSIDMTDVLSELKMKNTRRKQRPISIHSEMPSAYDSSYSKDQSHRMQAEFNTNDNVNMFGFGRSSIEDSPSRAGQDPRESRILRRQARSVADIDGDSFDLSLAGIASNPVTPRSARSLNSLDAKESALLEMEGTLKEFDEVIQSLDTEL